MERYTFYEHLYGTYRILSQWGAPDHVCMAGLFHAIYSTDIFDTEMVALSQRKQIKNLIGEAAEELVYYFCAAKRTKLFKQAKLSQPKILIDRFTNELVIISDEQFADLFEIALANFLDQQTEVLDLTSKSFSSCKWLRISSCIPSAKYSPSGSPPIGLNGNKQVSRPFV